jgi:hypothetical protein
MIGGSTHQAVKADVRQDLMLFEFFGNGGKSI